ncbi:MAG: ABC transporter permease [Bacteroidota bacterium]
MHLGRFIWEGIQIAFGAIRSNRLRSILTMLGVAMGIFAITGILTMVNSLQTSITSTIADLGNTTLFVHHFPWGKRDANWYKLLNRPRVSYTEYQRLEKSLQNVDAVGFQATITNQTLKVEGRSATETEIIGQTRGMKEIGTADLANGRYFTEVEIHLGAGVCVIGHNVAQRLFPKQESVGQIIRVGGKRLKVVGVMAKKGQSLTPGANSDDNRLVMPYPVMARLYNLKRKNIEKVIAIKASTYEDLTAVENQTIGIMRAARGLKPRAENNFAINKQEMLMNSFSSFFDYLALGGWVISAFSILIGGFSIGNIMYISVRERTNEIGVQKALGATNAFILYQFLAEAIMVCVLGGFLGILIVFGLGGLTQLALNALELGFSVDFAWKDMLAGLSLAAFIGLVAGLTPARMAARLDPVEAIRQA